jgi:hypothetical protein
MAYPTLAIIGTAGRKEDKPRLSHLHYGRMVKAITKFIAATGIDHTTVKVYSGGAAWADHIAVTMALLGIIPYENLTLFLPAILKENGYEGTNDFSNKTAGTANFYHQTFSQVTGKNSIRDLLDARERGGKFIDGNGSFHARNSDVAKAISPDGALLAYTFGSPESEQRDWTIRKHAGDVKADAAGLKDGGTADTWSKATGTKFHCRLGYMDPDSGVI